MTCRVQARRDDPSDYLDLAWLHNGREAITLHFTYPSAEAASEALDAILEALEAHRRDTRPSLVERDPAMEPRGGN